MSLPRLADPPTSVDFEFSKTPSGLAGGVFYSVKTRLGLNGESFKSVSLTTDTYLTHDGQAHLRLAVFLSGNGRIAFRSHVFRPRPPAFTPILP